MIHVTNDVAVSKSKTASMRVDRRSFVIDIDRSVGTLDFADLADRLAAMNDAHIPTRMASAEEASRNLRSLLEALARLRQSADLATVLGRAGRELCGAAVFDRVLVSRVSGSTWSPLTLYVRGADGRVSVDVDEDGSGVEGLAIALSTPLIEAEVVRRRLPALVRDADHEPRAHRAFVERTGVTDYVVAPVTARGSVIGLLHVDAADRSLSELDRDLVRLFADGAGLACECSDLAERDRRQRQAVADACAAVQRRSFDDAGLVRFTRLAEPSQPSGGSLRLAVPGAGRAEAVSRRGSGRLGRLTGREREVLALLASGATNAQLADQLTVAESTVKSHVKHILHKLGASNRAAAIACYLRESRGNDRRPR